MSSLLNNTTQLEALLTKINELPEVNNDMNSFLYNYDGSDFVSPYAICDIHAINISSWPVMVTVENLTDRDIEALVDVTEYVQGRTQSEETLIISVDAGEEATQESSLVANDANSIAIIRLKGARYV